MANRLIIALLSLTLLMQAAIFLKQFYSPSPAQGNRPATVQDAPKGKTINIRQFPSRGSKEANVVLIEFADYECPFCQKHATGVGKQLQEKFVDSGKIKHVFINNPLPMHPNAKLLASAALCAAEQNRYWEMHEALFSDKPKIEMSGNAKLEIAASSVGLDKNLIDLCTKRDSIMMEVEREIKIAADLKLQGTPGFAIGYLDGEGNASLIRLILGAQPIETFEKEIASALSAKRS